MFKYEYLAAVLLSVVLLLASAGAEFYEYKDAKGHRCFTDDLNDVPGDQRLGLTASQEIPLERIDLIYMDKVSDPERQQATREDSNEVELHARAKAIDEEQSALNRVFKELKEEKQKLGDPPPASAKLVEKRAYQRKVEELNRKIEEYENQRRQFEEKVANFITNGLHNR